MTKFHLITFSGGNVKYKNAQIRLVKQALRFDFFESITSYSQKDLDKELNTIEHEAAAKKQNT